MQARANRPFRDAEDFGDVLRRQVLDGAQEQHSAKFPRQARNLLPQSVLEFALCHDGFDVCHRRRARFQPRSIAAASPRSGVPAIERQPEADAGDPGAKFLRLAERRELAVRAEEGILSDFLRLGAIFEHRVRNLVNEAVTFPEPKLELAHVVSFLVHIRGLSAPRHIGFDASRPCAQIYCF